MCWPASPSYRIPGSTSCCPGTGKPPGAKPWPRRPVLTSSRVFEPAGLRGGPHVPRSSPDAYESAETTHVYLHADMQIKKQAMDRTRPVEVPKGVFRPDDELLAFLNSL